ncbi:hypothetical protein EIP91_003768 [Steccherinum ochraceum]|uniref:Protein kinase domain-containing protein n=1 Tax=Steccherinum ochraceum TaxID=92696 RepID=A0A4R0RQK7_9APHY|nr:hypothetical protein EIP91_003768 [Steccherinum ochraceum]
MTKPVLDTLSPERKSLLLNFIDDAIPPDQHDSTVITHIPTNEFQAVLDVLWELLDPKRGAVISEKSGRQLLPVALKRLTMKLVFQHNDLPATFYLEGVECVDTESRGAGGYADVYYGRWKNKVVALKRLRPATGQSKLDPSVHRQFCRESLMWRKLEHEHVLPFWGVSKDVFDHSICMVLPWMENSNIRVYLYQERKYSSNRLSGEDLVKAINKWLYQVARGLIYLHGEGVVHGDLHGANILLDENLNVRLTDFGMGLLAEAHPNNYGSKHGGGAFQFRAPELHDPNEFGLEDSRPTTASDVYAFACVIIELYTERNPFDGVVYYKVAGAVIEGERPPRPSTQDGVPISDKMWEITERCWAQQHSDRPPVQDVAAEIRAVVEAEQPGAIESTEFGVIGVPTTPPDTLNKPPLDSVHSALADDLPAVDLQPAPTGKNAQNSSAASVTPNERAPLPTEAEDRDASVSTVDTEDTPTADQSAQKHEPQDLPSEEASNGKAPSLPRKSAGKSDPPVLDATPAQTSAAKSVPPMDDSHDKGCRCNIM